jgi:hypothetical protein
MSSDVIKKVAQIKASDINDINDITIVKTEREKVPILIL